MPIAYRKGEMAGVRFLAAYAIIGRWKTEREPKMMQRCLQNRFYVNKTSRVVRAFGARTVYRLIPAERGYRLTVTMERAGRRSEESVFFPEVGMAEDFLALAARTAVTPLSLAAVYDDYLAVKLSLFP